MKIILSIDTIHRGGKERQLFLLTRELVNKGQNVGIITRNFSRENYLFEYGFKENIIHIYKSETWSKEYHRFKELISSEKPELLISWDLQTSLFAILLFKRYKFRFINASIQHGIRLLRSSHIIRSVICFFSPYVIANSFAGLRANNTKPGKRRFVLYNGIETKFQNKLAKSEIEELRKKLIPVYNENPGFIYVSVANFVPYKDYFTVLKALARLKNNFPFYYFILGDGPMRDEIEKSIKAHELEKKIILVGRTENVKDYLFASDIMIHSSRGEGISNAILEGMYAGLPVIATNVGGVPETIYPGSSMLFPYKNHEALYSCLLKSKELNESLDPGSEKYQAHLRKFSVETMVRRFEEIVNTVISDR